MKKFLKLFDDSGKLIRFCAPIFAVAASVVCLIWGIALIASTVQNVFTGLLVIIFGTGCSWLLAFMIDGFGKLVQVGEKLLPKENDLETFIPLLVEQENIDDVVICGTCGASNRPGASYCISCGTVIDENAAVEEYVAYSSARAYDPADDPDLLTAPEEEEVEEEVEAEIGAEELIAEEAENYADDAFDSDVEEEPYDEDYEEEAEESFEMPERREAPADFIGSRRPARGAQRPSSGARSRVQRPAGEQRTMRGRSHR